MRMLVIADIHGYSNKISEFFNKLNTKNIDVVVCPGDFTDMFNIPSGFTQENIAELVLQKLLSLNKPLFCVPGNHDPYEIVDIFEEYGVNIHNKKTKFNGFYFIGWGGAATPFMTIFEPSEEETKMVLDKYREDSTPDTIFVVHNPPYNTKLDKTDTGKHVGSKEIRKFIEDTQPRLVISAHIHERKGTDKIDKTTIFYPGPFFEGNYGVVEITKNKLDCKIYNVNK